MENTSDKPEGVEQAGRSPAASSAASDETDKRLLAAVTRGNDQAFAELYQRHSQAIFNYLLRLIHDQGLAEDLLQETFVAVWRGADGFKHQSQVKTWLIRIAHNSAVTWLRRHRPQSMQDDLEVVDDAPGPEMLLLIDWRNAALLSALNALSPNHRAVVELAFVQELPYSDIAEIMECPVGTVKSRMNYALKHLHGLMIGAELD
ncbi:MAG: sigma-70 family RNA polymerase sigma factor [Chloroflexota bacterium]